MPKAVKVIQCPTCGASSSPKKERCDYCGNYLLHLTIFEQRTKASAEVEKSEDYFTYFISLKRLYQFTIAIGSLMAIYLYFIAFNDFSETELVIFSPVWFLCIHFGISGLYTEKAVKLILKREAKTFAEGLQKATESLSPILTVIIYIVFIPPFFILNLKKLSSPLLISLLTTIAWAGLLYFFFVAIFPSL